MTTARVLTPPGRGAIAVVEVAGPGAVAAVDRWFAAANDRLLVEQPIDAIRFGRWLRSQDGEPDPETPGEELVVVRTAEDRVEVHSHGGAAAPAAVLAALVAEGTVVEGAPERSLAADARRALSLAPTDRVAGILLDQANGALDEAIRSILADVEAGQTAEADAKLHGLLSRERLGRRLTEPWRVVLAGPPNVGKSSLINALVGYERAIVYDQPGTTRDIVTATTAIGGWPVTLADTAGLRETDDPLEAAGVELARQTLARADVLVLVREATEGDAFDETLPLGATTAAVIEVANKADLLPTGAALPDQALRTVAPTGQGVAELLAAIERAFGIEEPPLGTAVPFRDWHFTALRAALGAKEGERRRVLLAMLAGGEDLRAK